MLSVSAIVFLIRRIVVRSYRLSCVFCVFSPLLQTQLADQIPVFHMFFTFATETSRRSHTERLVVVVFAFSRLESPLLDRNMQFEKRVRGSSSRSGLFSGTGYQRGGVRRFGISKR